MYFCSSNFCIILVTTVLSTLKSRANCSCVTVMALGIGQAGEVVKFKRSDVLGKLCGIVMEQDDYNGKKSSKIKSVVSVAEIGKA